MKRFAQLFAQLDQTTKTLKKVEHLVSYLNEADDDDKLWTIAILSHRRPKRTVKTSLLRIWASEIANVPLWLFEESYHVVGDLADTIALMIPAKTQQHTKRLTDWINIIKALDKKDEDYKKAVVLDAWSGMDYNERFVFNKLITGGFRIGVSQKLMMRAIAQYEGQEENAMAHRLMGNWTPDTITYDELIRSENPLDDISKPYPFYLAYSVESEPSELGEVSKWLLERKWDGIRGQVIIRENQVFVWSRGEELVTDKFPEYHSLGLDLPNGTVIDGEILPFADGKPLTFNVLQTRIGRKNITKKILQSAPVILMCYDLLEFKGKDIRSLPLRERRKLLVQLLKDHDTKGICQLSESVSVENWDAAAVERSRSRSLMSEGLMIKRLDSEYKIGRKKGDWWKWKIDPLTIDAIMLYAQSGHGRRANLFTDYTFAVWDGENLVPFTKAYSGLTDKEFNEITKWVRKNTKEKFGPVRSVNPELVFEIAFEGINASKRHKSGISLRFPRMVRWRRDKPAKEANTLNDLKKMLELYG